MALRTDFGVADLHQVIRGARKAIAGESKTTGVLLEEHGVFTAAVVGAALRGIDPDTLLKLLTEEAKKPDTFKDY